MKTDLNSVQNDAANGLALVRLTIGSMFVWVFFENLGKGLYTPGGYAGLISYYIKSSHSPAVWKAVMGLAASHAAIAAPLQGLTEISLGILLVIDVDDVKAVAGLHQTAGAALRQRECGLLEFGDQSRVAIDPS